MGEQDGDVEEDYGLLALWAEQRDAVDNVEREPADGKEKKDQSQRFGKIQLFVIVLVGVCVTGSELFTVKLFVYHVEYLCVYHQHEQ